MTCRAIIWCGMVPRVKGEHGIDEIDAEISRSDIDMAVRAAMKHGARASDIWALVCDAELLLPERFIGEHRGANLAVFEQVSQHLARTASPDDRLFFVATNHGDPDGLLVDTGPISEFDEEEPEPDRLSPLLLQRYLDAIPGQQIAVIATCYAGVFSSIASERRAVITVCGPELPYRPATRGLEPRRSPFLYELLSHWAGVSLNNYQAPTQRPMSKAFQDAVSETKDAASLTGTPDWLDE